MQVQVATERLTLRDFRPEDWKAVQGYAADPEAVKYRPFGPCSDDETREVVQEISRQSGQHHRSCFDLAIVLTAENQLIGGCDLVCDNERGEAGLGYILARDYWGQGYMTEAIGGLLGFAFEQLGVNRIFAEVEAENRGSVRVLEKTGFKPVGALRQSFKGKERRVTRYAITAVDWRSACREDVPGAPEE